MRIHITSAQGARDAEYLLRGMEVILNALREGMEGPAPQPRPSLAVVEGSRRSSAKRRSRAVLEVAEEGAGSV